MAEREVAVRLTANVGSYVNSMKLDRLTDGTGWAVSRARVDPVRRHGAAPLTCAIDVHVAVVV
jgi:hypothetical protein